jgi:hypothetical protein
MFEEGAFSSLYGVNHELDDGLSGNAFQDALSFAFFGQRRKLEPPGERLDVYIVRSFRCLLENGSSETILEAPLMFIDRILEELQHRDDDVLSTTNDLV